MSATIITIDDLQEFKTELLKDIKDLLCQQASGEFKKYLKSSEVMTILQVSRSTLQNLRINGTLPFSKIGGIIYYEAEEIQKVLISNTIHYKVD